jgi:hypothetical protein
LTAYLYYFFSSHCDKIPDRNNLRDEELILAHDFRGFSSFDSRPMVRRNVMVAGAPGRGGSLPRGRQEGREQKGLGLIFKVKAQ